MKNNRSGTSTRDTTQGVAALIAPLRGRRGTTLLELMFAMIVFATLLTIMAVFPAATAKSVRSVSDMRAAIIARSVRDAIKVATESAYKAENTEDSPVLITIVHDGLFAEDEFGAGDDGEAEDEEYPSSNAGVLTIQLPDTAKAIDVSIDEQELATAPNLRVKPVVEVDGEQPDDTTKSFLLAYRDNLLVRYPSANGKVYKLAKYLRDKESPLYNKHDNLHGYSFDIEVRQAVRERRPKDADGNTIYNTTLRVYDLLPNVYEFHIRIYYGWKPQSELSREEGIENSTLVHHFSFMASAPELKVED